ncbi:PREDICTED: ubiquitin carboxyl-terminal hydrolase 44-like [Priapulus caudatus]|uniref:ubiquitinyl hydrolase 1 n=1 Tax=Priapulus caudatus TaxID=37621 RepID=A0ABM1F9I9_PRICU|nr:PREDICTED: ubiquitin carboxyl-terminal hydrolase 44-like [Priapulus caudatus]XP_014681110.1 PREDICTED: ubiquitin carboxyl-terminal hydrolase 44-like [Priapulus caudatus]
MDKCKHVTKFNLGDNHSILNPQKWVCIVCGTTESVWACLNCKHVGCGRFNDEHAVKHFQEAGHPIAIEVNEKYVYCYICEEYVLNDNAAGDIKLLRTMLSAIATQNFEGVVPEVRSGRFLRSAIVNSGESESAEQVLREADKIFTAFRHRRFVLLSSTFYAWRDYVRAIKTMASAPTPVKEEKAEPVAPSVVPKRKHAFKPGVTGLRNLGNTCYMNSIIQVLGHITEFREYFINMKVAHCNAYTNTGKNKNKCYKSGKNMTTVRVFARQTTQEAKQHVEQKDKSCWSKKQDNGGKVGSGTKSSTKGKGCIQGGLNGGSCPSASGAGLQKMAVENKAGKTDDTVSLCHELHDLYRVLWSAKWAIVSPHSLLHAVWKAIPSFKGFSQQDAQEFLCELVERLQAELTDMLPQENALTRSLNSKCPRGWTYVPVTYNITLPKTLLKNIFQGELVSEVSCVACGHKSHTYEPFWDLSLEFPDKYNVLNSPEGSFSEDNCDLTEMLAKFTEKESLEGNVYACDQCNSRRRSTSKEAPDAVSRGEEPDGSFEPPRYCACIEK